MNDQSIVLSLHNTLPDRAKPVALEDAKPIGAPVRKRFRRGADRQLINPDNVTQDSGAKAPDPAKGQPKTHTPPGVTGRALTPYKALNPICDEWESLPLASLGVRRHFLSGAPLVNFFRRDPAAKAFDLLRTRLLQTLRANGWSRIAIASPTQGCGATFTAANLAQSLARVPGSRTVLMDINHRTPGLAGMLDMDSVGDMRGYLSGTVALDQQLVRASETLAVGLTAGPDPDAAEILHDKRCGTTLAKMTEALHPNVVLYDLPPVLAYDDLAAFLPQVDGVLLVADGTQTTARQIAACEKILNGQTQVLGIILNRVSRAGPTG